MGPIRSFDVKATEIVHALAKRGIKAPWMWTGSWSVPDYVTHMPSAMEYRKFSPGSPPVRPKIPSDVPQLVYDIKYYVRDFRRNNFYTASKIDVKPFDFDALFAKKPLRPEDVATPDAEIARPKTMPTRGY